MDRPNWMDYSKGLIIEWRQAMLEGQDVADMQALCELISAHTDAEGYAPIAEAVLEKMAQAGTVPGYSFVEPSDYEGILAELPPLRHALGSDSLSADVLKEKIKGAWLGRISGCLLGKPIEGMMRAPIWALLQKTGNFPLHKYINKQEFSPFESELRPQMEDFWHRVWWADMTEGMAPVDDDTNYTVMYMKLLETYGRAFTSENILDAWLTWMPILESSTAERLTYRNAAMGLSIPEAALFHNPCREWVGAQIRGDIFGYVNPGKPRQAAEMSWRDARVSHIKNGIYGEMFVSAMIAAAFVTDNLMTIVEAGLDEIPKNCRLTKEIERIIGYYQSGTPVDDVIEQLHKDYNEEKCLDWCQTIPNAMIVTMALLYGGGDFGKTICLAVQPAFDTDCNGATVGSIIGARNGAPGVSEYWIQPFHKGLQTSISGYQFVTVDLLTEKVLALCE